MCVCVCAPFEPLSTLCVSFFFSHNIFHLDVHYVCYNLCLFSTLSCRVGALQISIIIKKACSCKRDKTDVQHYLGNMSKSSERGAPLATRLQYSDRFMMAPSSTCPVWFIRLPLCGSTVKPRNVMLVRSGLKKMYGWGLQKIKIKIFM